MARILLVEDTEMNRDMLSCRLIRSGHLVSLATDGQQALDARSGPGLGAPSIPNLIQRPNRSNRRDAICALYRPDSFYQLECGARRRHPFCTNRVVDWPRPLQGNRTMQTSLKTFLLALAAVAAWSAPSQAQISVGGDLGSPLPWNVMINNPGGNAATTVTIYDAYRNVLTTDCLPAGVTRNYTGANSGAEMYGIFIRYQSYTTPNVCRGTPKLDTSYGPEIVNPGAGVAYPEQTVIQPIGLISQAPQVPGQPTSGSSGTASATVP